jgi:Xaa-Pro dipeptidase
MERREFIQRSASLAALIGFDPSTVAEAQSTVLTAVKPPDAPSPISEPERISRREKAQALMKQLGISALLIEPGANMQYFTGMEWGRSERLFAFLLPQTGKGIVVSPPSKNNAAPTRWADDSRCASGKRMTTRSP